MGKNAYNINTTSNNKLIKKASKQIITGLDLVINICYESLWHLSHLIYLQNYSLPIKQIITTYDECWRHMRLALNFHSEMSPLN